MSKKLFSLESSPTLEKVFDSAQDRMILAVVTGFDIYLSDKQPQGVEAIAAVSEFGPYVIAVKKFREAKPEELQLRHMEAK